MEGDKFQQKKIRVLMKCSKLLELAAVDDVSGFVSEVEGKGIGVDEVGFWYGRRSSSKLKMGFEERTPLMIASVYGSYRVVKYIIGTKKVDVNKTSDSDCVTALHCAAAGGSLMSVEVVKLLLDAGADATITDASGNKPGDLIARGIKSSIRKGLEMLLKGFVTEEIVAAKKEYFIDESLPDINNELYGSDEFRMYTFKVKPCSRAYTHDWTECPFVHPGENARRRDPKKFNYSCVPCPEFRKGSCVNGDACEYAHGVFESWLHPAQYKTRLCKDEAGCARKVCFFAHKVEELRPLYASTGSAIPSPKSGSLSSVEMGSMSPSQNPSPMALGSTPPMSPSISPAASGWQNKINHLTPPVLQLPGSRLRTALNARDLELQSLRTQQKQRQQMIDDLSSNLYTNRFGELNSSNLDDVYGSFDPSLLSSLQSPTAHQEIRQNSSQLRGNYLSSPIRKPANFAFDSSAAVAQAVINSRSGAFSKQRSQSFIDRGAAGAGAIGAPFSQWGSSDGKLEWGFNGEEANKFRKSASFGFRNGVPVNVGHEPDVSWVNTLVQDVSSVGVGLYSSSEKQRYVGGVGGEKLPQWVEQMFIEQERLAA